jgi:hypothetical protein
MTGLLRHSAVLLLFCFPLSAWGHGLGVRSRSVAYFYPVCTPSAPIVVCVPVLAMGPAPLPASVPLGGPPRGLPNYARPTPAPPSSSPATPAPPLAAPEAPRSPAPASPRRSSDVRESRSYYDAYPGSPRESSKPAGDRCAVGFWNLTGRDLTIKIDGQARSLAQGKNIQVDAGRQFIWQIEGRDPQHENVASGESALEIVIRR